MGKLKPFVQPRPNAEILQLEQSLGIQLNDTTAMNDQQFYDKKIGKDREPIRSLNLDKLMTNRVIQIAIMIIIVKQLNIF